MGRSVDIRATPSLGGIIEGKATHGGRCTETEIAKQTTTIVHTTTRFGKYADTEVSLIQGADAYNPYICL
jgi:hypothetical protein